MDALLLFVECWGLVTALSVGRLVADGNAAFAEALPGHSNFRVFLARDAQFGDKSPDEKGGDESPQSMGCPVDFRGVLGLVTALSVGRLVADGNAAFAEALPGHSNFRVFLARDTQFGDKSPDDKGGDESPQSMECPVAFRGVLGLVTALSVGRIVTDGNAAFAEALPGHSNFRVFPREGRAIWRQVAGRERRLTSPRSPWNAEGDFVIILRYFQNWRHKVCYPGRRSHQKRQTKLSLSVISTISRFGNLMLP